MARSHSLRYNLFAMFSSGEELPSYSAQGYLDGELFLQYDSESQRLVPWGTWLDSLLETDTWKQENDNLKEIGQEFRTILRTVMEQSNLNTSSHTFQETLGCELHEDDNCGGFWKYGYDGEDFFIFQPETLSWEAAHPAAGSLKNASEAEPKEAKMQKAKVEGDYCDQLWNYLKVWKERKGAFPLLNVTQNKNQEGEVTLRCWAYNIFPRDIKMTWLQDGYPLNQRDQGGGLIQPSGDGTYQTWVSIHVHHGVVNYTCHVEHQGRNQTISVTLGPVLEVRQRHGILAALLFAAVLALAFGLSFRIRKSVPGTERRHQQDGLPV
ncbi:hereditary hemochromatosis protein homolog [Trichosurus vulpecula]|uniref:hereditary hemochromatosis protein homolog n=1 Tax=Trichosurus vulpecula TaxID=9337 RepID=UPI00186AC5B1|nr:hereditary hemochromatosis protein homolog [Trichosurus vulpecula]